MHPSPMKTPKQLITTRVLIFIVVLVVGFIAFKISVLNSTAQFSPETLATDSVNQRIAPVAGFVLSHSHPSPRQDIPPLAIETTPLQPAESLLSLDSINPAGESLYKNACFACHNSGVANAPKLGDRAAWAPYIVIGIDKMTQVVMQGKGAMPPKGGAAMASEEDIRAAVAYMVNAAQ